MKYLLAHGPSDALHGEQVKVLAGHGMLYRDNGGKRIPDNALVALTLLIAESRPTEKETIVKVVINLINLNVDELPRGRL